MFLYLIHASIEIQAQNQAIISMLLRSLTIDDKADVAELTAKVEKLLSENRDKFAKTYREFADTKLQ